MRYSRCLSRVLLVLLVLAAGCGQVPPSTVTGPPPTSATSAAPTRELPSPSATGRTETPVAPPTGKPSPRPEKSSSDPPVTAMPRGLSLAGDSRNAFAFAPLDNPRDVTVEGRVSSTPAWSTSKVLIIAAFLDTAAGGDPGRVSATNRGLIRLALTESDADAILAIRNQIRGRPGAAMTVVLRAIGDKTTMAPDGYQGTMSWSIREQVRFMAALDAGKVVSRAASAYLLQQMHPIHAHSWGLGRIGARPTRAVGCAPTPLPGRWGSSTGSPWPSSPAASARPFGRPMAIRPTSSR